MRWLLILALAADLSSVKTEANPERRSELALDNANASIDAAREAYGTGDSTKMTSALDEVGDSTELSYQSLTDSHKNPRNNKYYKRAEQRTHELMRRLDGLRDSVDVEDRAMIEKILHRVTEVHDSLLNDIMGKKK